ncbi:MAG: ATP-binding protein [Anaerolineae bacterium]
MSYRIRTRFFGWLGLQTVLIFMAVGAVVFLFNLKEQREHPDLREEEAEEGLVVGGVMLLMLPLALGSAWIISRRLLRPWQQLVHQAERIGSGSLDERIRVPEPTDEIGRLAGSLNDAFDRYANLLDRLQRFSFDASHQLRNPLAAMRASGEVCLARPRTAEEYRTAIEDMLEDTRRLGLTVEQLLLLARSAQGALNEEREPVGLGEVVEEALVAARAVAETRDITITLREPESPVPVRVVRELVREALANLLDNALRFSPDGGEIRIDLERTDRRAARLSISDEGPGVPSTRQAELFRPFIRQPGAGRESTGLGLAIAADICRAHGGAIGVGDRPGGGARFWIELPLDDHHR